MKTKGLNSNKNTSALSENCIICKNNYQWFKNDSMNIIRKYAFILLIICLLPEFIHGQITFTKEDASCGASDGSATVSVSGGTAPYTYLWSNGGTGTSINNLAVGLHIPALLPMQVVVPVRVRFLLIIKLTWK